ncbi:MAG: hypothetical protein WBX25_28495 [Rhodomicrobium sp.]
MQADEFESRLRQDLPRGHALQPAQTYGSAALDKLVGLMNDGNDEIAFKAAIAILDRAYGKPAQTIACDPEQPLGVNVTSLDAFTRRIAAMAERAA